MNAEEEAQQEMEKGHTSFEDLREELAHYYDELNSKVPVVPAIAIIVLLVLGAWAYFTYFTAPQEFEVGISVMNEAKVPIKEAKIEISGLAEPLSLTTGEDGKAYFRAIKGAKIEIRAVKDGYSEIKKSLEVLEGASAVLVLKLAALRQPKQVTISFEGPDGRKITDRKISAKLSDIKRGRTKY